MTHATTSARPVLSVVVPVYDEAARIGAGLEAIQDYLATLPVTSEIVVVDDGSRDETAELARHHLGPGSRLLCEPHRGKGGAVRAGMLAADGTYAVFLDIDLATPLRFIEPCLERLDAGVDVVLGSRRTTAAHIERRQAWMRETLGRGFSLLSRLVTGSRVSDFTCGFKGFRREAARRVFTLQRIENWSFDTELVFLAEHLGLRIEELPVVWRDDHRTKVRLARDVGGSLKGLFAIRWNQLRGAYRSGTART